MLKKQNRLSRVVKKNKANVYSSPFFNIKIYDGEEKAARFGFVVSKKVSRKAVVRNKTKRVLREVVRDLLPKINSNKDIIIFSKVELSPKQKKETQDAMAEIFKKAKII